MQRNFAMNCLTSRKWSWRHQTIQNYVTLFPAVIRHAINHCNFSIASLGALWSNTRWPMRRNVTLSITMTAILYRSWWSVFLTTDKPVKKKQWNSINVKSGWWGWRWIIHTCCKNAHRKPSRLFVIALRRFLASKGISCKSYLLWAV